MNESRMITKDQFENHPLLSRLLTLHDVPKQIYIKGNLPDISIDEFGRATPRILTVVGARKNTEYGRQVIRKLLQDFGSDQVIILSGLALGIDGLAHKEALRNKITTIAIPGSGLGDKTLYPQTHKALAKEILEHNGALISELKDEEGAAPWTFPQRNRLMAALSDAVLIIEAEEKSGTLITARQALELGKDIGAVPGDIFSPTATGPHLLIKDGAFPITSNDDLFELLHLKKESMKEHIHIYSDHEMTLLSLLREPREKDTLYNESNLEFSEFLAAFSSLEIKGVVEETFGEVRKVV